MTFETNATTGASSRAHSNQRSGVHLLSCANCGTPLAPGAGQTDLACSYCGQRHRFLEPPEPSAGNSDFHRGDTVAVEWGGKWWSAHVVDELEAGKKWRIHFEGWAPAFDDVVDPLRIRAIDYVPGDSIIPPPLSEEPLEVKRNNPYPALFGILALISGIAFALIWTLSEPIPAGKVTESITVDEKSPISGPISDIRVTADTPVTVGQQFQVQWGDKWYVGTARFVDANGDIVIRYNGWGERYDEVVPRERLRLLKD